MVTDIGANAKMNEFAAVMGLCNLKYIEKIIGAREQRYNYYVENLKEIKGIRFWEQNPKEKFNYAYFSILIDDDYKISRDKLYIRLKENNIYSRKYFYPITADQECFKGKYKDYDLVNARYLASRVLVIPFYDTLEYEHMDRIIEIIR